jgi:hypothetical protein
MTNVIENKMAEHVDELRDSLNIPRMSAAVAFGTSYAYPDIHCYHVYLFEKDKKPPIIKWYGFPIEYHRYVDFVDMYQQINLDLLRGMIKGR